MENTHQHNNTTMNNSSISKKSRLVILLLHIFLGMFGIHRFYVGKAISGVIMIVVFIISIPLFGIPFVIWSIIDFITILVGGFTDNKGKKIRNWLD